MRIDNVVCLTSCPFDGIYQRPQALATAFAEQGLSVQYVTYVPAYRFNVGLRRKATPSGVTCRTAWSLGGPRLWRLSRLFQRLDGLLLGPQSRRWLTRRTMVLASNPVWSDLLRRSAGRAAVIVYDCYDDWGLLEPDFPLDLNAYERRLLPAVTLATVTTPALGRKLKAARPDLPILPLPNAVEFERFRSAAGQGAAMRRRWNVQGPILGFLGAIYDWMDEPLLYHLATHVPECTLMLCGPVSGFDAHRLERLPNVRFTGMVPYPEVPAVIDAFDVAIVPFRRIERMSTVNSNKFYQYLSMGKPIVTTDFPEVHSFGDLMLVAEDAEGFCRQARRALSPECQGAEVGAARVAYAERNSWNNRVRALLEAVGANPSTTDLC